MSVPSNDDGFAIAKTLFNSGQRSEPYSLDSSDYPCPLPSLSRGILEVLNDDIEAGGRTLMDLLDVEETRSLALTNLLFLVSKGFLGNLVEEMHQKVKKMPVSADQVKARLTLALQMGKSADNEVYDEYVKPYVLPSVRHQRDKTLVFYHIPKCAGTSVNQMLGTYFYGPQHNVITPGYIHAGLAGLCIRELSNYFPYLSTKHMGVDVFPVDRERYSGFTLFRNPVERLHSMFFQSLDSAVTGYNLRILPKYNEYWRYWDTSELAGWLDKIPDSLRDGQIITFSPDLDEVNAKIAIGKLSFCGELKGGDDGLLKWLQAEYVPVKQLPRGLNASNRKRINTTDHEKLKSAAARELNFLRNII